MATRLTPEDAERLRTFERRGHDALASGYRDFFSPVTALAIQPLLDAVALRPGMRLLDVATGPGAVAGAAAQREARAVGIDLAPRMITLARQLHPGVEFREADVEQLPFADAVFDAVVGAFAIGHLPYPEKAVAECVRTMKPGARLALSWWDDPSRHRIQALFREAIAELGAAASPDLPSGHSSLRFCARDTFRELLAGARLVDVRLESHSAVHRVESVDALWDGAVGGLVLTGSAIRAQTGELQAKIREALARRALAYQAGSGLNIPVAFNIASGRKAQ